MYCTIKWILSVSLQQASLELESACEEILKLKEKEHAQLVEDMESELNELRSKVQNYEYAFSPLVFSFNSAVISVFSSTITCAVPAKSFANSFVSRIVLLKLGYGAEDNNLLISDREILITQQNLDLAADIICGRTKIFESFD